jgi:hypothetical protein
MTAVFARILLRYVSGALITAGYLDAGIGSTLSVDPDVVTTLGVGIGVATEGVFALAHKYGWTK